MKKIVTYLSPVFLFFGLGSAAQTPEKAVAVASYELIHIRDTTQRDKPYTEDFHLLLGAQASAYSSWSDAQAQELLARQVKDQFASAPDPNHVELKITGQRLVTSDQYYQFPASGKLVIVHRLINDYLMEEPMPAINWKISSDTLTISGYPCQKATAHFKGRDYTAWFCSRLLFHSGPWKLNGLPGLILQAEDSKKEVRFLFRGFQEVNSGIEVALPKNASPITQKEYDRLVALKKSDPSAFYSMPSNKQRESGPMGDIDNTKIASISVTKPSEVFSKTVNNPIELPEK